MNTFNTQEAEATLMAAMAAWRDIPIRARLDALVCLLGSPHVPGALTTNVVPIDEALIFRTWRDLMWEIVLVPKTPGFVSRYIMAGLLENNRWEKLLDTKDDAHAFAALVVRYVVSNGMGGAKAVLVDPEDVYIWVTIHDEFQLVLGTWLSPVDLAQPFKTRDMASALFGEAWCTIILDNHPRAAWLDQLILVERPEFLPGHLNKDPDGSALTLPDISF
jgi:hypothetical protein